MELAKAISYHEVLTQSMTGVVRRGHLELYQELFKQRS
jgi:hypothetical protein